MKLTEDEVRHIATRRAMKPFSPYLKAGSLITLWLVIFSVATELFTLLYILAGLWTVFIIGVWYMTRQRRARILKELNDE